MEELFSEALSLLELPDKELFEIAKDEIIEELDEELRGIVFRGRGRQEKEYAHLSREECLALLEAYTKGKLAFRNNLVVRFLYVTGLRAEEAYNLQVADLLFDASSVFVRAGKGNKDRYVFVDVGTQEILKEWIKKEKLDLSASLFGVSIRQIRRIVEKAGNLTGISEKYDSLGMIFSTHSLRHSFASHSYENGMKISTLKRLLGHDYLGTTLLYLHVMKKYEGLEYLRSHPLGKGL